MDKALIDLYHRHVAAMFDRQMRLADFLEREASGEPWNYTISTANLSFGDAIHFVAFDIGSHADPDNSWLWAWCHPHLNLTEDNRKVGSAVRKFGYDAEIRAFTADQQVSCAELLGPEVSSVAAHVFAVVVSGELGFDAYYTMPFSQGRAAAVIRDNRLQVDVLNPAARMVTIFPQVIAAFPVPNHRAAFIAYAKSYGLAIQESQQTIRVLYGEEEALSATFDRQSRMIELTGRIDSRKDS